MCHALSMPEIPKHTKPLKQASRVKLTAGGECVIQSVLESTIAQQNP